MSQKEIVIASAARTPIGSFQGAFSSLSAPDLGAAAVREAVRRAGRHARSGRAGDPGQRAVRGHGPGAGAPVP